MSARGFPLLRDLIGWQVGQGFQILQHGLWYALGVLKGEGGIFQSQFTPGQYIFIYTIVCQLVMNVKILEPLILMEESKDVCLGKSTGTLENVKV